MSDGALLQTRWGAYSGPRPWSCTLRGRGNGRTVRSPRSVTQLTCADLTRNTNETPMTSSKDSNDDQYVIQQFTRRF